MVSKESGKVVREKKHWRMRSHLSGTAQRPCLSIPRSNSHTCAQIIDSTAGRTLVAAFTLEKEVKSALEHMDTVGAAVHVGKPVVERVGEQGISAVVFDGDGFLYTGRIQVLTDATRGAGL